MNEYIAPWWLPGGNLQTIWPALRAKRAARPRYRRERWDTPDGDFIDIDWLDNAPTLVAERIALQVADAPLLVLFHGLEGSSDSHYATAFAAFAQQHGFDFAVPHFRGCSGELNRGPRAYHSGDHEEIDWVLRRLRSQRSRPVMAVGVSLGGNALLRWAGEMGSEATPIACAVAALSSPVDLAAGGHAIGRGFNRQVYNRMFLASMKPKALEKLAQHPGLFDAAALRAAADLHAFDDVFTAPLHGFRDVADYWERASSKPHLHRIRVPALVVNARNDPFVPASSLPRADEVGPCVTLWQPAEGGHVGFPAAGGAPGMPAAVGAWLAAQCHRGETHG